MAATKTRAKKTRKTPEPIDEDDDLDDLLGLDAEDDDETDDDDTEEDLDSLMSDDDDDDEADDDEADDPFAKPPSRLSKKFLGTVPDANLTKWRLLTLTASQKKAVNAECERRAEAREVEKVDEEAAPTPTKKSGNKSAAKDEDGTTDIEQVEVGLLTFPKSYHPHEDSERYTEESIATLAKSIKKHGLIYPIHVAKTGKRMEVVAGKRRSMAYEKLGRATIPARVVEIKGEDAADTRHLRAMRAFVDNAERADLSVMEKADALKRLQTGKSGLEVGEVAKLAGRSKSWVTRMNQISSLKGEDREAIEGLGFEDAVRYAKKASKPKPAAKASDDDDAEPVVRRGAKRKRVQLMGDSPVNNPLLEDSLDESFPSVVVKRTGDDTFALEVTICVGEFTAKSLKARKGVWCKDGLAKKIVATAEALVDTDGYGAALRIAALGGVEHLQQ